MSSTFIDFGATAYPTVSSEVELNEALFAKLIDGYINELKHYVKRPGLTLGWTITGGSTAVSSLYRTRVVSAGTMLAASGTTIYKLNSNGSVTAFTGDAITSGTVCSWAEDGTNVFVAHGGYITRLDLGANTMTNMDGGNAPTGVTKIGWMDGFLVANGLISGGVSGDLNFSDDKDNNYEASDSWEAFNNEFIGDSLTNIAVQWQQLMCFGPESMEASYNDGTTPFSRVNGGISPYGLVAPDSMLYIDNTLYYLSRVDGAIRLVRLEGYRPVLASEQYDRQLQSITTISTGRAFPLVVNGKPFYCISFGSPDSITLVFNLRTRTWTQFGLWDGAAYGQFAGQCGEYWPEQQKFLVGDRRANGLVYTFTGNTDNGTTVRFELTSNVHRKGNYHGKRCSRVVWNTIGTAGKVQFRDVDGAFPGTFYDISTGLFNLNRLGRYFQRQWQVVNDSTSGGFTLCEAEEWYEILQH